MRLPSDLALLKNCPNYCYNQSQAKLYPYDRASGTTLEGLETLRRELPAVPLTVVWDGASYHRAQAVTQRAEALRISVLPLPGYSPDFMLVEHLWQRVREDVTYHTCYDRREELMAQIEQFQQESNAIPYAVADRLWVKKPTSTPKSKNSGFQSRCGLSSNLLCTKIF